MIIERSRLLEIPRGVTSFLILKIFVMSSMMQVSGPNPQEIANEFRNEIQILFRGRRHHVKAKVMHLANLVMQSPQTFPYVGIAPAASPYSFFIIPRTLATFLNLRTNLLNRDFKLFNWHRQRLNNLTRPLISQNNSNFQQFLNLPGISLITILEPSTEEETQQIESTENQATTSNLEQYQEPTEEAPSNDITTVQMPFFEENDYDWWNHNEYLEPLDIFSFDETNNFIDENPCF